MRHMRHDSPTRVGARIGNASTTTHDQIRVHARIAHTHTQSRIDITKLSILVNTQYLLL